MTTPLKRYEADLRGGFAEDSGQRQAARKLDALYRRLLRAHKMRRRNVLATTLRRLLGRKESPTRGLYLWGGVGRGKTWLMDAFHETLPMERKLRLHFHRFMQGVHRDLGELRGQPDPLELVADRLAERARVLCFDEFYVADITDAMLLAGLLKALFDRGVTLVATSNTAPADLYRDGLQRSRFLPAIALLEKHTEVFHLDGDMDHRLRRLERAELYHCPLNDNAEAGLERGFRALAPGRESLDERLEINGREIQSRRVAEDVAWFEFAGLCDGPRSQEDYIELARVYHALVLGNVPQLGADGAGDDQARRFIALVDECYDRNVKLVISAAAPIDELYIGGRLAVEFERTRSRLWEMQSREYLASPHRP